MCNEKMIADIDAGRSVVIKKGWLYFTSFIISSGVIAWLFMVVFWVADTDNNIAQTMKTVNKISEWKEKHTDNHDEVIYNLTRLLEANGLEWKSFKK